MHVLNWLLVIVACLGAGAGLGYYKYQQIQDAIAFGNSFPESVQAVESWRAHVAEWQPQVVVTGEVVAPRTVDLVAELPGRATSVEYQPGSVVKANQVLVRLDTREERAQLAAARSNAALAQLTLKRFVRLVERSASAIEKRDIALVEYDAANATVKRLETSIDRKVLRAPFTARTSLHQPEPGQYFREGDLVTRLTGISKELWVDFSLPQGDVFLAPGTRVVVRWSGDGSPQPATVIAREPAVNTNSRNVTFRARLPSSKGLTPGMLISVEVPQGSAHSGVVVPATAVRRSEYGPRLYILEPAESGAGGPYRARERPVVTGPRKGDLVTITEGLQVGELVAANGAFKLRDGELARAMEPGAAPGVAATRGAGATGGAKKTSATGADERGGAPGRVRPTGKAKTGGATSATSDADKVIKLDRTRKAHRLAEPPATTRSDAPGDGQ